MFNALNAKLFLELFIRWVNRLSIKEADLLNIDGKASQSSGSNGQSPLHWLSAWVNLVLGQESTDQKSNEITAISALLRQLDMKTA
ncbi:MAG: hypothetical protein RLZZ215_267 [Pseudomonadota bacterium]|jgi:hypothetical protein